jgi:methyl-accepting chemotaxis protein
MDRITSMAQQVGKRIVEIAGAAAEQSAKLAQIRENVERVTTLGQCNALEARQSAEACGDVSQLAGALDRLVEQFGLRSGSSGERSVARAA